MQIVLGEAAPDAAVAPADALGSLFATVLDDRGAVLSERMLTPDRAAAWVVRQEASSRPRWVWSDTAVRYPPLLAAGVRLERAHDLRLCRRILRGVDAVEGVAPWPRDGWDDPGPLAAVAVETPSADAASPASALFDLDAFVDEDARPMPDARARRDGSAPDDASALDPVAEYLRQRTAVAASPRSGQLSLLLAAESVGALAAAEMSFAGLPWRADEHDRILTELLGPRPERGRPPELERLAEEVRIALDARELDPDSPVALLSALQHAGLRVESTRSWELREVTHPAIAPLLEYKRLARIHVANGWHWLDTWVREGRFRPVYLPGGVVTGRWASEGGGALQLPKAVRGAVVADPGWALVVADAAQLEPRVLAAMSGDTAMARAGRSQDLYEGIVAAGAVADRREAKYGMLGAIYGGTSGVSARVLPRLERTFPTAMGVVADAARAGERGERVRTWLGRTSPAGRDAGWDDTLTPEQVRRRQADRRAWGRFTRNFVVQGTAAEWAMCWIGSLRARLWALGAAPVPDAGIADAPAQDAGAASAAPTLTDRPHLAFFLHDELVVHAPIALADAVAEAMRASAADAGRMLFPDAPVEWAVTVAIVKSYDRAK